MTLKPRKTAPIVAFATLSLIVGSAAWAGQQAARAPQEEDRASSKGVYVFAPEDAGVFRFEEPAGEFYWLPQSERTWVFEAGAFQDVERAQQRRDEAQRLRQEIRVRPTIRIPGPLAFRSSSVVSTVLANADELGLTSEQEATIRELRRAARRSEIRRDADMEIAELDLEDMMAQDTAGLDAIEAKMRELANLQVDDRMEDLRLERAVLDALTAEQRDQIDDLAPGRLLIERFRSR